MDNTPNKKQAVYDFMQMIYKSWTYGRMTDAEQAQWDKAVEWAQKQGMIRGTYRARWDIMQAIYHSFLYGLGYNDGLWREPNREEVPQF